MDSSLHCPRVFSSMSLFTCGTRGSRQSPKYVQRMCPSRRQTLDMIDTDTHFSPAHSSTRLYILPKSERTLTSSVTRFGGHPQ